MQREIKRVEFIPPVGGDVITDPNMSMLKILFLYVGGDFWNSGSGDACIEFYENNRRARLQVLFSDPHGFYLRCRAEGEDFHTSTDVDYSEVTKIHVCGNPLVLPLKFFIPRERAFNVVHYFCQTGRRIDSVAWLENSKVEWDWDKYLI